MNQGQYNIKRFLIKPCLFPSVEDKVDKQERWTSNALTVTYPQIFLEIQKLKACYKCAVKNAEKPAHFLTPYVCFLY